ncbi:MAG TPA: OsmC family protein [Actinomycetota bacterium]|nr:OsmC family protein [Actinomycetota bacterium]
MGDTRRYGAEARSTDVVGRLEVSARHHQVLVDGPTWNGFPGQELMPGELFLGGVAACAVELLQMFARDEGLSLGRVAAEIRGEVDPDDQPDAGRTVFNRVRMRIEVHGLPAATAEGLVERFKGR